MMKYRFYKEEDKWYIDLPAYIEAGGEKPDLEMVLGADEWLNNIAGEKTEVFLKIAEQTSTDRYTLGMGLLIKAKNKLPSGAFYVIMRGFDDFHVMWLCDVTMFVFEGNFPNMIRYEVVEN